MIKDKWGGHTHNGKKENEVPDINLNRSNSTLGRGSEDLSEFQLGSLNLMRDDTVDNYLSE